MLFNEQLLSIVSQVTGVGQKDILSKSRNRDVCLAKHLYCYFLREKFNLKLKQISSLMNNDHSTVLHSLKVIENMIWTKDDKTLDYLNEINVCMVNLEGFNFTRKFKVNVPIGCDVEGLKTAIIEDYGCSIEFIYE